MFITSRRWIGITLAVAAFALFVSTRGPVHALSPDSAPPLPPPSGNVVNVSTVGALQGAVASLSSNTTIVIAPGTYNLTSTLWVNGTFANVTIRGASNNRNDVVLVGQGMGVPSGAVPFGIWSGGNVSNLTIANLTIRDIYQHPLIFNAGTESPRVYNVRLLNAGQQFLKANPDGSGGGVDNGVVEYSVFEYTTTAVDDYTNGVDVHTGQNWVIRHNLFRRIRAPQGMLAGPSILMWNGSSGTIAESNTFIDCHREIAFGLITRTPNDHTGGIVRNNFIVRNAGMGGDVGIGVWDSPGTKVVHNTIFMNGQYPNAIEYRFPDTTGVMIVNNLSDRGAQARDGATATLLGNIWTATGSWFVDPPSGDLHIQATSTAAIDHGANTADSPFDWDTQARPVGGVSDVGADEFTPGPIPPPVRPLFDYEGDFRSDWAVVRKSGPALSDPATWFLQNSLGVYGVSWGGGVDVVISGNWDFDSKSDIAVWRPGNPGVFYVLRSLGGMIAFPFGTTGDDPTVVADYDGDYRTDFAVYRPGATPGAQSYWWMSRSADGVVTAQPWGVQGDVPAPGDYDGDNRSDFVIRRAVGGAGVFYLLQSTAGAATLMWGTSTDRIASADYDGDGRADHAVVRDVGGQLVWYILQSSNGALRAVSWGATSTDTPTPADYDGDRRVDIAIWRESPTPGQTGFWVLRSTGGHNFMAFGTTGDYPIPSVNVR